VSELVVEPVEFAAVTVTLNVPTLVGVPVMAPVSELIVSPLGRPAAWKLVGTLV
jgi:hypothetical protein